MNERHNKIVGCSEAMNAAARRVDCYAGVIAQRMVELDDAGEVTPEAIAEILRPYRQASEVLTGALANLAGALRH